MRVLISAEGDHEPKGLTYMVVDNHGLLIDLSGVAGTLVDPTILRAEWGPVIVNGENREAGTITRQDATTQTFADATLLKPYLDAFRVRKAELEAQQAAFIAAEEVVA